MSRPQDLSRWIRARTTIIQAARVVPAGEIDPHMIHSPGIYVDRIVVGENPEKVIERRKTREG